MFGAYAPASHRSARPWEALRKLSDRTSLRTKLITAVLALVIMALLAISIASIVILRSYLTTQQDGTLQEYFSTTMQAPQATFGFNPAGYLYPFRQDPDVYAGIQLPGSQLLSPVSSGSGGLGSGQGLAPPSLPTSQGWAATGGQLRTFGSQSGPDSWRVIAGPLSWNGQQDTLVVAYNLGNINGEIQRVIVVDLIVGGAIVLVLAAVGVAVVRANLRPLNDIEMTAGQIARGHLNHRIRELDPRTEIGSLGHSLNVMLSQIETAFHAQEESEQAAHDSEERMRRFIADASHELRTPLTTIRGFAEYYRQRGGVSKDQNSLSRTDSGSAEPPNGYFPDGLSAEDLDHIMQRLEAEASRMGLLVEDLLQLARLDQQRPLDIAPVDLLQLAVDAVQDARMVAPDRPVDLIVAPGAAFIVDGDEARLRQVIGNLVANALTHTPPGTPVRVRIASGTVTPPPAGPARGSGTGGGRAAARPATRPVPAVVLDVEDDGPGMTAEQARRVFERFYRADKARSRTSGGTGLGLAIVAGLVAAHGGTVAVRTAPGQGADFQVRLPLAPAAAQGDDHDDPAEPDDEESQAGAF